MAAGRSATHCVWRQAFIAERGQHTTRQVLVLLWGLRAAYEHVDHLILNKEAQKTSFPAAGRTTQVA